MRASTLFLWIGVLTVTAGAGVLSVWAASDWSWSALTWPVKIAVVSVGLLAVMLTVVYRNIVLPLKSIARGIDLLRAQDFSSRLAPVRQREADMIVSMFNAMMGELKEQRLHVREQNHFMDLLISNSPTAVITLDSHGCAHPLNGAARELLGDGSDGHYGRLEETDNPMCRFLAGLKHGESSTIRLADAMIYRGVRLSFMDRGYEHPFFLVDQLTTEVARAQKEAYGKVIRLIAHEVNNTVTGVTTTLTTAVEMMRGGNVERPEALARALTACAERSMQMSRFISSFAAIAKIPEPRLEETDLNRYIEGCRDFMESLCKPHGVRLVMMLAQDAVVVKMDVLLFEQVLVNVVKNAVESIDGRPDGEIRMETRIANHRAELVISDNGAGISEEAAANIFTPFYSSKAYGQGLGLLFVSDVLRRSGYRFSLQTDADGITRFSIRF